MDTVRLLDHYRTAATQDPMTFRILAYVFHHGRCTESDIESLGPHPAELRRQVLVLFRSNLLRREPGSLWTTTELADLLLARAGLAERSMHWLIDAWRAPEQESAFLKACVRSAEEHDLRTILQQRSLIQALSHIRSRLSKSEARSGDLRRALYAAIVGLDSRAESLGPKAYCEYFIDRAPSLKVEGTSILGRLQDVVKTALGDARASNNVLVCGQKRTGKSALALTWARLLSTAASGLHDEALCYLAPAVEKHFSDAWNVLRAWKSDLNEESFHIVVFSGHGSFDAPKEADEIPTFVKIRLGYVTPTWGHSSEEWFPALSKLVVGRREPPNVTTAKNELRHLLDSLEAGVFDDVSPAAKQELCGEIDVIAQSFRSRLLGSTDAESSDT